MRTLRPAFSLTCLITLLALALPIAAQEDDNGGKQSIFDLMNLGEVLKMELETNLVSMVENKNTDDYQAAVITFDDRRGRRQTWEVELRVRGRFRRRVCAMPPLKLKFDKDELKAGQMKKHNELKLVTHCLDNRDGKEYLLREYLTYKLYALLSPVHYRAQLVRIKYVDPVNNIKISNFGILLEDENELAKRLDSDLCEDCFGQKPDTFDPLNLYTVSLFEYMIGNTDWSVEMLRNVKLLRHEKTGLFYAAPYDFDFSGLVNATYAIPDPSLKLPNVRERYFQGPTGDEEALASAVALFRNKREDLLKTVNDFSLLSKSSRTDIRDFLRLFYLLLDRGAVGNESAARNRNAGGNKK